MHVGEAATTWVAVLRSYAAIADLDLAAVRLSPLADADVYLAGASRT